MTWKPCTAQSPPEPDRFKYKTYIIIAKKRPCEETLTLGVYLGNDQWYLNKYGIIESFAMHGYYWIELPGEENDHV